jgi:hypothetical protein
MNNKPMKTSPTALPNVATMKKKLCVVQFPHPKDEATPTRQLRKSSPILYQSMDSHVISIFPSFLTSTSVGQFGIKFAKLSNNKVMQEV